MIVIDPEQVKYRLRGMTDAHGQIPVEKDLEELIKKEAWDFRL